jgi:hypothetical protein
MPHRCDACYHWKRNNKPDLLGRKPCKRLEELKEGGSLRGPEEGHFCDLFSVTKPKVPHKQSNLTS